MRRPPSTHLPMGDIRSFFKKDERVVTLEASDEEQEPCAHTTPSKRAMPPVELLRSKTAKLCTIGKVASKVLVVKSERAAPSFVSKQVYQTFKKHVFATHRNIRVRTEDTVTHTIKQRGQIDAEIGEHDEWLGCDELLALVDTARTISELILDGRTSNLVVIAHRHKGVHGAYLLGKISWKMVCEKDKTLSTATKVGEPTRWLYRAVGKAENGVDKVAWSAREMVRRLDMKGTHPSAMWQC